VRYCPIVFGLYGYKSPISEEVWTKNTRMFVTFTQMGVHTVPLARCLNKHIQGGKNGAE
jgi:hypothetical protein